MIRSLRSDASRRLRSLAQAFTMISGPMPAGSPIVIARCRLAISFLPSHQAVLPQQREPQIRRPKSTGLRYHINPRPGPTLYHGFGNAGLQPPDNAQGARLDRNHLRLQRFAARDDQRLWWIDRLGETRQFRSEVLRSRGARHRARCFKPNEGDTATERALDPIDICPDVATPQHNGLASRKLRRGHGMI